MPAEFLTELDLRELGQDRWLLLSPLVYKSYILTYPGELVTVPKGFETDLESIPRWLPVVYSTLYGTSHHASVVHDWLYTTGRFPRETADAVMYEAILARGEPPWKAYAIWAGLRVGGWVAWNGHRKNDPPDGDSRSPVVPG